MITRLASTAVALAVAVALATGCTPEPAPTPTPTGFATEDEAFAAAEETYRAYVDAVNARRADPQSDPDPQMFLIGNALEDDIDAQNRFNQLGITLVGTSDVASISLFEENSESAEITVDVCLDSSATTVLDRQGADVTPVDRQSVVLLRVSLSLTGSVPSISESKAVGDEKC